MSTGAGPPDWRHTMRAVAGSAVLNARMSSENWPFAWRANTAPNVPQQSESCVPLHFTHMLTVPAVAAFSPPPPGTLTYCNNEPLNPSAPPATPFRSGTVVTPAIKVPLVPRVAFALPSNGQYESSVALLRPPHELSSKPGFRQVVPRSVPEASNRQRAFREMSARRCTFAADGKLRPPGVPSTRTLEVQFSGGPLVEFSSRLARVAPEPSGATGHLPPSRYSISSIRRSLRSRNSILAVLLFNLPVKGPSTLMIPVAACSAPGLLAITR